MDTGGETSNRTKQDYRDRAKQTLASISIADRKKQSEYICKQLNEHIGRYNVWAVFIPFEYEPDISSFIEELRKHNKIVLIPQRDGDILRLAYYKPESIVVQGTYGEGIIADPEWYAGPLDICLVPGLVFDQQGYRIGHGKGYYDRFLAKNRCFRMGVCYKESYRQNIPYESHDQKIDIFINE